MRAVVQRVSSSSVTVDGAVIGSTKQGLLVLVGEQIQIQQRMCNISAIRSVTYASLKMNRIR